MVNLLIIGAAGQIARVATGLFLKHTDVHLTLFLRDKRRLRSLEKTDRVRIIEGDATDPVALAAALVGQTVVYANLAGDLPEQATAIVHAMHQSGLKRLIWISSMGIYDEIPGERHGSVLDPYRDSARIIEESDLDYTIIRPAWLNDRDEIRYGTTRKGESFANAGASVSRKSVADLVVKLALTPGLESRGSLGVHHAS